MLIFQRIQNRFVVQCGSCSVMHGNLSAEQQTGCLKYVLKALLHKFPIPQTIHCKKICYLNTINGFKCYKDCAFFKGNSICCRCSKTNIILKNNAALSLQRHLSQLVTNQLPPSPKTAKPPKINFTLVEELQKLDQEFELKSKLRAVFPLPKSNLHNNFAGISSQLNTEHKVRFSFQHVSEAPACWQCTVTVPWPTDRQFTSRGASKSESANRASLLALEWLQTLGKLDSKGEVDLKVKINRHVPKQTVLAEIQLSEENIDSIDQIVSKYYKEIVQVEEKSVEENEGSKAEFTITKADDEGELEIEIDSLPIKREKTLFPHVADRRDQELFRRFQSGIERRDKISGALPIHKFREEILSLVENNRVVVVKGEPGCGKSTQVPQYILESYASVMTATDCNIVVTQPRRISAISLAERVAHERDEQVGDVVGYQVRLNAKRPKYSDGYILFCSTGLLLRKIVDDPGLSGVTHVIVDEAHERDTQVDFLLLLLKRALEHNPSLKVIVMSATINAHLFTNYFNDCPSISIPGFTYPVKHHFLDNEMKAILQRRGIKFDEENSKRPSIKPEAILEMILWIDQNKPDGAILVFLPGWLEIRTIIEEMTALNNSNHFLVVPAHSKLNTNEQKRIFEVPKDGKRKVILATNIAETSLTINDVVYVIDSGAVKEERLDLRTGLVCLDNQWVSQANVSQRRGRAGRVQPGESYHMFSEERFNSLEQFPIPEISRIPLTRSVLDVKMYTKDEDIRQFLLCLPEAPGAEAVAQAIRALQGMGALDNQENLTSLGRRIYKLPLDPHISKALVHACIFRSVNPILTVATLLSADYPLFEDTLGNKSRIREVKQKLNPSSDHLALSQLYRNWELQDLTDPVEARLDCQLNGVFYQSMERTRQLCELHAALLKGAKLIPADEDISDTSASCNAFSQNDDLLKSILLSGLGKLLIHKEPVRKKDVATCTMDGSPAVISSESVIYKTNKIPTPFLLYFKSISSTSHRAVMVRESSLVSPLSVALFLPGTASLRKMPEMDSEKAVILIEGPKPIIISVNEKDGERLLHLRNVTMSVLEYFMANEGEPKDLKQYENNSNFRNDLLLVLAKLLNDHRVVVNGSVM